MNALCYKIVFSKRLGTLVAVGEHTAGQGKAAGTGVRTVVFPSSSAASADNFVGLLKSVFASVALSFVTVGYATAAGPTVNTLPTGYSVNSGNVAISTTSSATNAAMTIQQTTDKASVNWNSFSIGSGAAVNVQQNNANSVLLNRVVGNDPSQIFGKLTANGQVILINPNGIVFGKGGSVTASAFTASTFGMTDADFNNGKHKFSRNGSTAGVTVESGARIDTTGYVALIGASVDNQGAITTQGGAVVLAAGDSVALPSAMTDNISVPLSGKVRLELMPSTINAMVANSGTITTDGGQVLMKAAALSDAVASITHTGIIDTTGEQGGAVTMLADGGVIKATGSITANSTAAGNKGGDIVIGRDEVTGVLAKSTDVSGAKLESKGGFVETSGDYLATDGVSVKAAQWLLDPSDITISNGTDAGYASSGMAPALTYTPITSAATSIVKVSTIKSAIDAGTSVMITTTNTGTSGSGAGNITIADALAFANNSNTDATLSLIADNGITQNTGASITTSAVTGKTGLVNISMTAKGNYQGNTTPSANSQGITLNAAITTNGDITLNGTTNNSAAASASNAIGVDIKSTAAITAKNISVTGKSESSYAIKSASALNATGYITLDGTSKNWVGVETTGKVTAGGALKIDGHKTTATTTAASFQGININSAVKGASVAITGDSVGHYGVGIGTSGSVESTGTPVSGSTSFGPGDVTIIGTGTGNTAMGTNNNAVGVQVRGNITAKGKLSITGTKDGSGGFQGVTFSDSKTITGDSIEITGTSNAWDAVTFNSATLTATKTLKIVADSTAVGKGILFSGGSTNTLNADSYLVTAKTMANNGIYFSGTNTFNSTSTTTDSLIDVTRTTAGGETIYNAGTLTINSGLGKAALQTSTTNIGGGIRINGGSTVNTNGDVTIGSKNSGNSYTFNQGTINAQGNLKLLGQSTGDGISMQDSGGTGSKIVGTNGANIILDGTSSGGGTGVSLSINVAANSITTTGTTSAGGVGNISITGTSALGHGISNAAAEVKNNSKNTSTGAKGNVTLTGTTLSGSGQGIYNVALGPNASKNAIYAEGDLTLKGYSVNGHSVNIGGTLEAGGLLQIEGTATATGANAGNKGIYVGNTVKGGTVSMTGITGGSIGVEINAGVTTGGNITVTAENTSGTNTALLLNANGKLLTDGTNSAITINTNGMDLATGALVQAGTTGTGTVNIKTTGNNNISVGGADVTSNSAAGQTLGINNTELGQIKAGNLVIGDTGKTGNITVSGAVSTANATGNITLQTGGSIAVDQTLAVDSTKTLTLKAGGNITDNDTTGVIKASKLELLGNAAAMTLDSKKHEVGTLAADVKSLTFANKTLLTVGSVTTSNSASGGTVGIKAKEGVNVTTQTGDLTLSESISNQTSGNVVVGAGVSKGAGDTTDGDVQTATGKSISNTNGKTFVYSGSAANTGALGNLDTTLSALKIDGTASQNADTNAAFGTGAGISINGTPSTANAQAIFREKVSTGTAVLSGATVNKTYGDASTAKTSSAAGDLLTEAKTALKSTNTGSYTITNSSGNNTIEIDKAVVIDSMTGNISGPTYNSTNTYLKAATHNYGALSSSKYTTQNIDAGNVKVAVAQRALNGLIAQGSTTYGDALAAGAVTFNNKVGSDDVNASGVTLTTTGKTSTSGNLKAGTHTDVQSVTGLTGADKDNYTFANVKGSYKVEQKALTGTIAQGNTTYGETLAAGAVSLTNRVGTDVVDATGVTFTTTGKTSTSGNLKAGTHTDVQSVTDLTGADKDNYTFAAVKGSYKVEQKRLTGTIAQGNTTYGDTLVAGGVNLTNKVGTDVVGTSGVTITTTGKTSTSGNLKAGTHADVQTVSGLTGDDKDNYTVADVKGSYKVDQKALTGSIVQGNTTYGDTLVAGAVNLTNKVGTDVVGTSGVTLTTTGKTSTSGNLKAGTHTDVQSVTGLTGADKDNYTFANVKGSYKVDQKSLTAIYAANNKVFDGNTTATLVSAALQDKVAGDVVTPTNTSATFDTAAVGTDKTVTVAGIKLTGADAANYTVAPTAITTNKPSITAAPIKPPSPVVPTDSTPSVKIPVGSANPFALASAEDLADETCSANSIENCYCEPSELNKQVDICYEPKAGAKSAAR